MPKVKKNRELFHKWLDEALKLETGAVVAIPCVTITQQKMIFNEMSLEIRQFTRVDPVTGTRLELTKKTRNKRLWVMIEMLPATPTTGIIQLPDGTKKRVSILEDGERRKRLELMHRDGLSLGEVQEIEGELTEEEEQLWRGSDLKI